MEGSRSLERQALTSLGEATELFAPYVSAHSWLMLVKSEGDFHLIVLSISVNEGSLLG